ncbi:hypothetical protein N7519_010096 [Penicillium mononematosum]|uniref:uncharacterized protein n=1 Tax=Penicillium mononematosum TaxID=268346 RepID=UPI002546FE6F|nr:uncharacterized protein N7519_010096 [Penicillium mononematosum]KAJ6179635.1 hypothetical protein N7519_010096 [Penicillium mononematosum]
MELLDLPTELILMIEEHLPTKADVSALMRPNSAMFVILQKRLYRLTKRPEVDSNLRWACERGNEDLASAMLDMGADIMFSMDHPAPLSIAAIGGQLNEIIDAVNKRIAAIGQALLGEHRVLMGNNMIERPRWYPGDSDPDPEPFVPLATVVAWSRVELSASSLVWATRGGAQVVGAVLEAQQ